MNILITSRTERAKEIISLQEIWNYVEYWVSVLAIPAIIIFIVCISYAVLSVYLSEHFSRNSRAQKYLIRRSIRKYPELRVKIKKHLEEKGVLTRGNILNMVDEIVDRKSHLALQRANEENRQKQLNLLDKDL